MKKIFLAAFLMLLVLPFVLADDCSTAEQMHQSRLQIRYELAHYRGEVRRVSMEAVIEVFDEDSVETTGLVELKDDLVALYEIAEAAANDGDRIALEQAINDGKKVIDDFRDASNALLNNSNSTNMTKVQIRERIATHLQANEEYLNGLKNQGFAQADEHRLLVFDTRVCIAQRFIDRLEEHEIDVEDVQDSLDAISARREEYSEAISVARDDCGEVPIVACIEDGATALKDLELEIDADFKALREDLAEARRSGVISVRVRVLNKRVDLLTTRIERRENLGEDMTEFNDKLEEAKAKIAEAEEAEFEEASGLLDEARDLLNEINRDLLSSAADAINSRRVAATGRANVDAVGSGKVEDVGDAESLDNAQGGGSE